MSTIEFNPHIVTQQDATHLLSVTGYEGLEPGSFSSKLIEAALSADTGNQARLALGFGSLMEAVKIYQKVPGGVKILQWIAGGKQGPQPW